MIENTEALSKPLPPLLENKFQRNGGIIIGIGLGLLLIGSAGALIANQTYSEARTFLSYGGVETNNYLLNDMIMQIAIYLTITTTGAIAALWGLILLRSNTARELTLNIRPHARLSGGLIGGGGALAFGAVRFLFMFLLTSDQIQIQLFIPTFAVGILLMSCGILVLRKR
jgi:hypothetical protein